MLSWNENWSKDHVLYLSTHKDMESREMSESVINLSEYSTSRR